MFPVTWENLSVVYLNPERHAASVEARATPCLNLDDDMPRLRIALASFQVIPNEVGHRQAPIIVDNSEALAKS